MVHHPATIIGLHNQEQGKSKKLTTLQRMNLEQGNWVAGSEESFWTLDTFLTREDAEDYALANGFTHVGTIDRPNPADYIDVAMLLDDTIDNNEPFGGEWFEGYLSDGVTPEMIADLKNRFAKEMEAWLTKHDLWPVACNVRDVEQVREIDSV